MREILIENGVRNLRRFGYPQCSSENITKDPVYREFFRGLLNDWIEGADRPAVLYSCKLLLAEIDNPEVKTKTTRKKKA